VSRLRQQDIWHPYFDPATPGRNIDAYTFYIGGTDLPLHQHAVAVGKGNHKYMAKEISFELEQKLLNNSYDLIDKSTYYNDLQKYDISSHDFRFTSARDKFEDMLKNGISEKEAKQYKSLLFCSS
jgi:hypothetical protein